MPLAFAGILCGCDRLVCLLIMVLGVAFHLTPIMHLSRFFRLLNHLQIERRQRRLQLLPRIRMSWQLKAFSFSSFAPDPLIKGCAPGARWGLNPQTSVIGSRSVLDMGSPRLPVTILSYFRPCSIFFYKLLRFLCLNANFPTLYHLPFLHYFRLCL